MLKEFTMFDSTQTAYLVKARAALAHPIPGDATFLATVASLLRSMIDAELISPDRVAADKQLAADAAKAAADKAQADLEARHKAEQEALNPPTLEERLAAQKAALDEKQAAEKAALDEEARVRAIDQPGYDPSQDTQPAPKPKYKASRDAYAAG